MNAIQRWYVFTDGSKQLTSGKPDEAWCRSKDVEELERVIADQSSKQKQVTTSLRERISFLERTGMDMQRDISAERREHMELREAHRSLQAKYDVLMGRFPDSPSTLYKKLDAMLAHCDDPECSTCATIICPHQCAMHFHHDGCPACAETDTPNHKDTI